MIISRLPNNEDILLEAATWLYMEWLRENEVHSVDSTVEMLRERAEKNTVPLTLIAQSNEGKLLGLVSLTATDMRDSAHSPWLSGLYISTHAREQGVGSALVRAVIDEARGLGFEELYLFTRLRADLVNFYTRLGFYEVSRQEYHGEEVCVMKIIL